jgi:hypothetical protein
MWYIFVGNCRFSTVLDKMKNITTQLVQTLSSDTFSDHDLATFAWGSQDSRYGQIRRAIQNGDLIHIRRGLYRLAKPYARQEPNLYSLAQQIYGPSYVSLESALSYHGWIPEAVYVVTSVCTKRSREFRTPLGLFGFHKIPSFNFYAGVQRKQSAESVFLMASPWKALLDYVYVYKKDWRGLKPVVESLRVEEECFENCDFDLLDQLLEFYGSRRVERFVEAVRKELKP